MTRAISLDPSKTAPFEPVDGDERHRSWIAASDIPTDVVLTGTDPRITQLDFKYTNTEPCIEYRELDTEPGLAILVTYGKNSQRIRSLLFDPGATPTDLPEVARRIHAQAIRSDRLSIRYNHQMIAAILKHWRDFVIDC